MANRKKRAQKRKQRFQTKVGMILVTLIVVCFAGVMVVQMKDMRAQEAQYAMQEAALTAELADEEQRSEDLEESREYVKTKEYIEEIAREKLGLVNPDETVVKAR